jgi:hypothetical protein
VERGPVGRRSHRRHRRDPRSDRAGRCHDDRRRDSGPAVAPAAAASARRGGLLGLQVAVLPAWDGLHGGLARDPADVRPPRGRLVRGARHLRRVLRPPAAPHHHRPPSGRLAGLARLDGRGDDARRAAGDRRRGDARP